MTQVEQAQSANSNPTPDTGIHELLQQIRSDVDIIRAARPEIDKMRQTLQQAQDALNKNDGVIKGAIEALDEEKTAVRTKIAELKKASGQLSTRLDGINTKCDTADKLSSEIERAHTDVNEATSSIKTDVQAIEDAKTTLVALKTEVETEAKSLRSQVVELDTLVKQIKDHHSECDALRDYLFEDDKDEAGNIVKPCLETQFENLKDKTEAGLADILATHKKVQEETDTLKRKLEDEIRALLPGAGSAGLAWSYNQAKGRYAGKVVSSVYYAMFICPLLAIAGMYYNLLTDPTFDLTNGGMLAGKLLITIPLGLVSWFGHSSIRLNRRLYEEYNHKQRVMELYYSFKKEIDQHGGDEQKGQLLQIMLEAVADKPSLAMSKYDKGIEDVSPVAAMMGVLTGTKKMDGE